MTRPLDNLGLEHLDIVVPDPAVSARFYSRIFKAALHQQPVRDTMRYCVLRGDLPADLQVGCPSTDERDVVRFTGVNCIVVEVRVAE